MRLLQLAFLLTLLSCFLVIGCTDSDDTKATLAQSNGGNTSQATGQDGTDTASTDGSDGVQGSDDVTTSECGDGKCDANEQPFTCPQDCEGSAPAQCLLDECKAELMACQENDQCMPLFSCQKDCLGNADCEEKCRADYGGAAQEELLGKLITCGQSKQCVGGGPAPTSKCGNGKCEPGETPQNCEKDCNSTPVDPLTCLSERCGKELNACATDPGCTAIGDCNDACGDDEACKTACYENAPKKSQDSWVTMLECGIENNCFGSDPISDCLNENCSEPVSACMSNPACTQIGDCTDNCGDNDQCKADCYNSAPPQAQALWGGWLQCGQENQCFGQNDPVLECLTENCQESLSACFDDKDCGDIRSCMQGCGENEACEKKCFDDAPKAAKTLWENWVKCGQDNQCFSSGDPVLDCLSNSCGDSLKTCIEDVQCAQIGPCIDECDGNPMCEGGCYSKASPVAQSKFSALIDCGQKNQCFGGEEPPKDNCGNGKCDPGENPDNCSQDCKQPPPGSSCKGQCGADKEMPSGCWCDDACEKEKDCCDDYKAECVDTPPTAQTPMECAETECKKQINKCTNNTECSFALWCVSECKDDWKCAQECDKTLEGQAKKHLNAVLDCAEKNECY